MDRQPDDSYDEAVADCDRAEELALEAWEAYRTARKTGATGAELKRMRKQILAAVERVEAAWLTLWRMVRWQ